MENNVRKGRCRNYGDCDRAGEEFTIVEGKPFECPECHQPLTPLDGPKVKSRKKGSKTPFIIGGVVALVAIVIALYFVFRIPEEDVKPEIPVAASSEITDSVSVQQEAVIPNRNDTLVIKVDGMETVSEISSSTEVTEETVTEQVVEKTVEAEPVARPAATTQTASTASHNLGYGTWTGGWKNGKPHGTGTMTYSTTHTIDPRDSKERVAQPGEYIVGEWDNGNLVQGRWFKKDGTKEAIIIGKAG